MEKIYTPQNVLDMERWFWGEKGAVGGGGGEGVVEGEQRRARLQQILKNLEGGKRGEGEEGKGVGGKHVSNWMEHPLGRFWVTNLCNAGIIFFIFIFYFICCCFVSLLYVSLLFFYVLSFSPPFNCSQIWRNVP